MFFCSYRKATYTRKPCRLSSTPSPAPRHTILRCGPPPHPLTATSARVCCGASLDRECAVRSAGSKCTRNAKSFWTPTAYRVSEGFDDGHGTIFSSPCGEHRWWLSLVQFEDFRAHFHSEMFLGLSLEISAAVCCERKHPASLNGYSLVYFCWAE